LSEPRDELAAWDAWLADRGRRGGFLQTSTWARILGHVEGASAHVTRHGEDAGALWLLRRESPSGARARARALLRGVSATLECRDGPVLPEVGAEEALTALLGQARDLARAQDATRIAVTPPPAAGWSEDSALRAAFERAGFAESPWLTGLVDLRHDDDALRSALHRSARKAVRRAQEIGVVVRVLDTREEIENVFLRSYAAWSGLDLKATVDRALPMHDLDEGDAYAWFLAEDSDGVPLGTLGTYRHAGVATEIASSRNPDSPLPAQDILHWKVLLHHRDLGDEVFDLAGFSPEPESPKEAGIRRFKEKWAGTVRPSPRYELDV
jgi:hypothetical protein